MVVAPSKFIAYTDITGKTKNRPKNLSAIIKLRGKTDLIIYNPKHNIICRDYS